MSQNYRFLDYELKPEELSLYHKSLRIDLGLKGFKVLLKLLESHGKVVPKDELIASAWQGQIVTSGTLNKQIEFLRQIFSAINKEITFIETKRGIGYQFVADVKIIKNRKKGLVKWQKTIASVSIIPIVILLYFYPFSENSSRANKFDRMPFNIAVIPSAQGLDFENTGGLTYLSTLLDKNPHILSISPEIEWFENKDKNKLAIEIENQKDLDYVLLVDIKETEKGKFAQLELKNSNQFNQKILLTAISFKQLFADINTWTRNQLKINKSENSNTYNQNLSDDSFALESFLRGTKESHARKYNKAIQYFQMAITQDDGFDLARLKKSEAHILSNDYHSAQAILETIDAKNNLNTQLQLFSMVLQSNVFIYTEKAPQAIDLLKQTIEQAIKANDDKVLNKALYLQASLYVQSGQVKKAIESILSRQKLIYSTNKDSDTNARVSNNLAYVYYQDKQLEKAKKQIKLAITGFEKGKLIGGMLNSYDILAHILYDSARFEQAQAVVNKGIPLIEKIENKRLILWFLETRAYLQFELGNHSKAKEVVEEIEQLAVVLKTNEPDALALGTYFELALRKGDKATLSLMYQQMSDKADELKKGLPILRYNIMIKLISANLQLEKYDLAALQINEILENQSNNQEDILFAANVLNVYLQHKTNQNSKPQEQLQLHSYLLQAIDTQQLRLAIEVAYIIMDIAIENNNFNKLQSTINQIAFIEPFAYPYLKYKAKLAAHNNDYFTASENMQKMKNISNEWFNTDDQLLMDSYFEKLKQKNNG